MKRWILPLIPMLLMAGQVMAETLQMEGSLVSPSSSRPYINIDDCKEENREALSLRASWSSSGLRGWTDPPMDADVFISVNENCGSVSFEIGKSDGADLTISETHMDQEIKFPESDSDVYTLADLVAEEEEPSLDCGSQVEDDYYICVSFDYTYKDTMGSDVTDTYVGAAPIRIDLVAPGAPTLNAVNSGEENLKIEWEPPDDDDIGGFVVYYREEGVEGDEWDSVDITDENATGYQITGLTNHVTYEVTVAAYDLADNEGFAPNPMTGTPVPILDFYEYYRKNGGKEKGGFCFVATAAYGSYDDYMVEELREFRDEVLAGSEAGRGVIAGYYRYGPRWARAIRGSDAHRAVARWALLPAVGVVSLRGAGAGEWVVLVAGLFVLGLLVVRFRRWLGRVGSRAGAAVVVAVALMGVGGVAGADEMDSPVEFKGSEPEYQLQLRFGPYYPEVDSEGGVSDAKPFREIFGSSSKWMLEIGIDWEFWRGFGAVSAGVSIGFVQYLGKGRTEDGEVSTDTTVLNLLPMRLSAGYHFTKIDEWWHVPLVPYVQAGLSYYVWWVTDGVGDVAEWDDGSDAMGGIFGLHFGLGLKLLLDFLDRDAANSLEADVGVKNTFFFVEYEISWVDGFGSKNHMNVGDDTFMIGLMFEF